MHVFTASDVYDYGKTLHYPFFVEKSILDSAKIQPIRIWDLIYSSRTESEFELRVQTRLRKYSAAYQAQKIYCQNIANCFILFWRLRSGQSSVRGAFFFFNMCLRPKKQTTNINTKLTTQ